MSLRRTRPSRARVHSFASLRRRTIEQPVNPLSTVSASLSLCSLHLCCTLCFDSHLVLVSLLFEVAAKLAIRYKMASQQMRPDFYNRVTILLFSLRSCILRSSDTCHCSLPLRTPASWVTPFSTMPSPNTTRPLIVG